MNRDDSTPYKLELTEEEFHELHSILHTCDYFHQIGVKYNHVQHLERLFQETERKANNPYLLEARHLVESFYLGLQQLSQRTSDIFNPVVSCQQPLVRLAVSQDVLRNEEAAKYLTDNIPSGLVDWYIIPSPFDSYSDPQPRQVCLDFRTPSSMNVELNIEESTKRGFFEE